MKTYIKETTTTEPRLQIKQDDCGDSPREWSNLGYFITQDSRYYSPDKHERLQAIIKSTGDVANSREEHIKMITAEYQEQSGEHIEAIYSVCKYEHSGVCYKLGEYHDWDYSNNGFYIVTTESQKEIGTKKKDFEKVIKDEIETYNKYINGEVYSFILYDKDGEVEDSCGGFYDVEDIRSYLPKEWSKEDLTEYVIW